MGFFKKIFKGIKKVFKKIGKAVKSVFKKVGKFMGKIGIVGQLGLALVMPYALPALGGLATGMMGTQVGGFLGSAIKGAGHFLNAAVKVGTRVGSAFKSVTSAVTKTIGNMVGATINSIPGGKAFGGFMKELTGGAIDITGKNFSTAWEATQNAWSKAGSDLGQLFSKSTFDSSMNKFGIQASLEEGFQRAGITDPIATPDQQTVGLLDGAPADMIGPPLEGQAKLLDTTMGNVSLETMQLDPTQVGVAVDPSVQNFISQYEAPMPIPLPDPVIEHYSSLLAPSDSIEKATSKAVLDYQAPMLDTAIDPVVEKSLAAQAGARGKEFLKSQGVEMSLSGVAQVVDSLEAQKQQQEFMKTVKDPFAFVDMSYLTPAPIQTSPGLSTAGLTPMSGFDYFNQIQDDILNSNYNNIYAEGYYGAPSLQAGLAMAYQELNQ